jgi:hypothetical protein
LSPQHRLTSVIVLKAAEMLFVAEHQWRHALRVEGKLL